MAPARGLDRLVTVVWRLRWLTWVVVAGLAIAATALVPPVQFDQSVEGFFAEDNPSLVAYQKARSLFGSDDLVFVAYVDPGLWSKEGMDRLEGLAAKLAPIPGVVRVESLDAMPIPWRTDSAVESIAAGRPSLIRLLAARSTVGSAIRSAVDDPEQMNLLRTRICEHPLFRGVAVDPEGTMTCLLISLQDARTVDHKAVIRQLRERGDEFGEENGFDHVSVAGPPVLVSDGFDKLDTDNRTLGVIAMALMALTMLVTVRNPGWALLPLVAGWSTWQLVRTMLWKFDLRLTLSSGPIVAQTVVLCMPAAAHLAMRFRELRAALRDPLAAARLTLADIAAPIAWCALTAAIGYLAAWITSDVLPISQFGLTMAVSNLAAGGLSFVLAAGAMGLSAKWGRNPALEEVPQPGRVVRLTAWIIEHPWVVVGGFVLPAVLAAMGSLRLELESNYINVFRQRSRVLQDYRRIEERLGGIGIVEVVLPAPSEATADSLKKLRGDATAIRGISPEVVSGVLALDDLLLPENEGELSSDVLNRMIYFKVLILGSERFRYVLDRLWNPEKQTTRVMLRIRESAAADEKQRFLQGLKTWAAAHDPQPTFVTGLSELLTQITDSMISTSFNSAAWSAGLVFLMLTVSLRSPRLALFAMFPTVLSVGLVVGVMGWGGLKIDMTTALVASVAIGLSVDDTFHCLLHWRQEMKAGHSVKDALLSSYASSGPGVILGSSAVSLGFLSSMYSEFVPTANFGWLVALATLGGSLGNLIMLPAILVLTERRK